MSSIDHDGTQKPISRREFLRLAALTGGATLLSACGGQATTPASQATPAGAGEAATAAAPAEATATTGEATAAPAVTAVGEPAPATGNGVRIAWWNAYSTATTKEVIPIIVKDFQELYPGVTVEYEISGGPPGGGNFNEVLLSRIAGGNPPEVATLFSPPVEFAARGSLLEIDEMMRNAKWARPEAFYSAPLKSCQWQGKTYGLPSSAGAGSMYFNVPKFKEKGVSTARTDFPKRWDELKNLSAQFTVVENDEIKEAGFVPWGSSWLYPAWSALNGGQIFDAASGRYVLDSEQNVRWLEFWLSWLDDQYGGDIEKLNQAGTWAGTYPDSAFNQGRAAMAQEGSWSTTDAEIPFEWDVAQLPVGPEGSKSVTGFWPNWWTIPKGSPHPQEAFLFIEYFSTKGWETWYRYIMDTPAWKDFPRDVVTEKLVKQVGQERAREINDFFATYLENAVEMWTSPVDSFASDTLNAAIDEVLHKSKTPQQALKDAQGICQAKLEEVLKGV